MAKKSGVSKQIISLPKGGGAIKGIGETFKPNLFTGTANFSVPIATSPGRDGFGPELTLQYSSGNGNGPFGLGWALSVPQVSRKTEKGLPRYTPDDTFLLSGAEDLVQVDSNEENQRPNPRSSGDFFVTTYRPRVEGLFARIEKWELKPDSPSIHGLNDVYWKITTKDNVTNIYGRTKQAVLENPDVPGMIYQWLLELTYDAKGNYIYYEYKHENGEAIPNEIYEQNRRHYQVYLKRIHYGNQTPFDSSKPGAVENLLTDSNHAGDCFFQVVFDYGEHGEPDGRHEVITSNMYNEVRSWNVRPDSFSSFRSGFEIRTYRLCKRVLMFHNKIPGEENPVLVKSTDFLYQQNDDTLVLFLAGGTQRGYKKADESGNFESEEIELGESGVRSTVYEIKSIPRLDFGYTDFKPKEQRYKPFEAKGGDMPPTGLSDPNMTLVDLFGTGLPDVLQTTPTGYYFWRNLGDGLFDRRQVLKNMPAGITLDQPGVGFGDMAGDGQADLLVHAGKMWGFYEATNKGGWKNFHPYRSYPSFELSDPNVRLVDLTGDGKSDVLRTDECHFSYFPSRGEDGFGEPEMVERIRDLEDFPDVYFSDQRVRLADMTGDGLNDIVLIHSGRVDYWPNLGYGRFGKRITMKNAPRFGFDFDPSRLFLADIDGSGPVDILYIELGKVKFWFNQSGNGWSEENSINGTPNFSNADSIQLADMFGNGSTGILYSSDYRSPHQSNYLFLDLTGGVKPYVLTEITNNMGATAKSKYTSSTRFYLDDLKRDEYWITTVPFPVQVLEKAEVIDHIAKSKLVTKYSYHHGYFDGGEREFRGFARVEQLDTEFFEDYKNKGLHEEKEGFGRTTEETTHVPPILTRSWFHTGVYEEEKEHLEIFRDEYYAADPDAPRAHSKVEVGDAPYEAYRALRGANLRTEVYALDGSDKQEHPYTVTENGFQVKQLQKKGDKDYGIFFTTSLESFTCHYERNPEDPRIAHSITHEIDEYGNVLKSLDIVYPRRKPAYPEQGKFYITMDDNKHINQDEIGSPYLIGVNYESKDIELKIDSLPRVPLLPDDVDDLISQSEHNLFAHTRSYFDGPDYTGLELGKIGSRGLLTRTETLAFKQRQIAELFGDKVQTSDLTDAGYRESPADSDTWWIQSQRTRFTDQGGFFMVAGQMDPMGNETTIDYDQFHLLPVKTIAPLGTVIEAENDYRILSPFKTIDPNLNHSEVAFDVLGMVIATALMGKVDEQGNVEGDPIDHPTTRMEYDFFNYWRTYKANPDDPQPNYVRTFKREEHYSVDPNSREQESYTYSDGFGREIQTKIQAEPGPIDGVDSDPRWVGSGWKVYNNKGWVVEEFEPFFSPTHEFEADKRVGVSDKMTFDPLGRAIRTDNPDGTFAKVDFDPWKQTTWDENDTVAESDWYTAKSQGSDREKNAAAKALAHNNTPTIVHLDTLGRSFLSIEDNGTDGKYETHSEFDIQGNVIKVIDPRGNTAFEHKFDLLKNPCHTWQMDSGERWVLNNAADNPFKAWDSRDHLVETIFDELNRPTQLWVTELTSNTKRLAEETVYGETQPEPETNNLRGQVYRLRDGAGEVINDQYDFKGNLLHSSQRVLEDYKNRVDWSAETQPEFTDDLFEATAVFDALSRVKQSTAPDGTRYIPTYNEANFLEKVDVHIRGAADATPFVLNIDYDAKGQRTRIEYANGVVTEYAYDPDTYRLVTLRTHKDAKDLQHFCYTYDPVGNITSIEDKSTQTVFFNNNAIDPNRDFTYDALYRLIEATGREHIGQLAQGQCPRHNDVPVMSPIPHPNDPGKMRRYKQTYVYDQVGNILEMGTENQWHRTYTYNQDNNRLIKTTCGQGPTDVFNYRLDAHGNHLNFPHIDPIEWDFEDQMVAADLGGGGKAYYLYDADGDRVRKVVRYQNGNVKERIYLGGYEIFREYNSEEDLQAGAVKTRRDTNHVMDDERRIAMIETLLVENHEEIAEPIPRTRYQLGDHLGSANVETDEEGKVISFEEYHPYGTTSYHSTSNATEVSRKRYRYNGKEKDEETGLYYHGARYYTPWLARWISVDPIETQTSYPYTGNNPLIFVDPDGKQQEPTNFVAKPPPKTSHENTERIGKFGKYEAYVRVLMDLVSLFSSKPDINKADQKRQQPPRVENIRGQPTNPRKPIPGSPNPPDPSPKLPKPKTREGYRPIQETRNTGRLNVDSRSRIRILKGIRARNFLHRQITQRKPRLIPRGVGRFGQSLVGSARRTAPGYRPSLVREAAKQLFPFYWQIKDLWRYGVTRAAIDYARNIPPNLYPLIAAGYPVLKASIKIGSKVATRAATTVSSGGILVLIGLVFNEVSIIPESEPKRSATQGRLRQLINRELQRTGR